MHKEVIKFEKECKRFTDAEKTIERFLVERFTYIFKTIVGLDDDVKLDVSLQNAAMDIYSDGYKLYILEDVHAYYNCRIDTYGLNLYSYSNFQALLFAFDVDEEGFIGNFTSCPPCYVSNTQQLPGRIFEFDVDGNLLICKDNELDKKLKKLKDIFSSYDLGESNKKFMKKQIMKKLNADEAAFFEQMIVE